MDVPSSTLADVKEGGHERFAPWARRGFLLLLVALVVTGLLGYLGVHDVTTSSSGGGYRMSLRYARIARPGQDVPWELTITHPGGFDAPVTIEATSTYFDIFESQGMTPQSTKETQDDTWWRPTFDAPGSGDTLVISMDFYIQPLGQHGASGTVRVLNDQGHPVDSLHFNTTVMP